MHWPLTKTPTYNSTIANCLVQPWARLQQTLCPCSFHDHLNRLSVKEHIQFAVEKEKDGVPTFLDVLLTNLDGTIETSVHHKQTHTDRYLDFLSYQPLSHKKSVVTSLLSRAKALSSTVAECTREKLHVTVALKRNSFPASYIRRSAPPLSPLVDTWMDGTLRLHLQWG